MCKSVLIDSNFMLTTFNSNDILLITCNNILIYKYLCIIYKIVCIIYSLITLGLIIVFLIKLFNVMLTTSNGKE